MANKFVLVKRDGTKIFNPRIEGLTVDFYDDKGSLVKIHEPCKYINSKIIVGSGSIVNIMGTRHYINKLEVYSQYNKGIVFIKEDLNMGGGRLVLEGQDGVSITIGKDCLISDEVIIRAADGHTLFDRNTRTPVQAGAIEIGDHCWLGQRCVILKNSRIANNSVVGACAVVAKKFEEPYVAIAGNPARIVKRGIDWDRRGYNDFMAAERERIK